ncbi:FkbM family methyltransferase [Polynucleobacter wuianus]|uniref:FkbM family methyltransferase n=1 Tax=Polynucleobacter wuianus TaxID=1743168 RepID=UPI001E43303E|nr:FkbM family methyltransferase [Polynucleobacter wuianus]
MNNLDEKLEKYLNYDNGYFIELGANDGVHQSNTLYYEKYRGWGGILVEPTLHNYLLCRQNRSAKNKFFCNACTSFEYEEKFVEIIYSNLMSIPLGLETDIVDPTGHAKEGKQFLQSFEENVSFGAVAKTLNQIMLDAQAPKMIDFLSLDVEGAEIEVLKGIDHHQYKFKFMCIESRSFDRLNEYLTSNGYVFVEGLSHWDYLFALKK